MLEKSSLQLQNLAYERTHIRKEITHCKAFIPHEAPIELISLEEFRQQAPAELQDASDAHSQFMKRLEFEHIERKRMRSECVEISTRKRLIEEETARKRAFISQLQPQLESLAKAAEPIQSLLGVPGGAAARVLHATAAKLPTPLYVLFQQASALSSTMGTLSVSIGEEDGVIDVHPSYVLMHIQTEHSRFALRFSYMSSHNIVLVGLDNVAGTLSLRIESLMHLFGDDSGLKSPNAANQFQNMATDFNDARPFLWVQWLCGLFFMPEDAQSAVPPGYDSLPKVLEAIQARLQSQWELQQQLSDLIRDGRVTVPSSPAFPVPAVSKFARWSESSLSALTSWPASSFSQAEDWTAPGVRVYVGELQSNTVPAYNIEAAFAIGVDYPNRPPLCRLRFAGSSVPERPRLANADVEATRVSSEGVAVDLSLAGIEREVNIAFRENIQPFAATLTLSYQLRRLQQCFDIYVAFLVSGVPPTSSASFVGRSTRGRDRRTPYALHADDSQFDQRE
eukprot:TRINITY_DN3201_c0_g1_i2.p1 TRINITY_DN3201_c0_g1~~TRINITY_DN3201_c0_g1_i2.p1  ORF type:complete len:508 (-),score=85.26 TRINITY_DN3201_c0_g1_i2:60-1583(-)